MTADLSGLDAQMQFRDAIARAGLTPPDNIRADGELHRFASNGKRGDDAGWYVFHANGIEAGCFGDWRTGQSQSWRANIGRKLSPVEAAELTRLAAEAKAKRKADEAKRHAEARERATATWQAAIPARADHPYLAAKGIEPHGIRQCGDDLIIPMRDASGELHSLQTIAPDGTKLFAAGGRVTGCYFAIDKPGDVICISEGFATAASVHEATGNPVAVAFNAGNLTAVARELRAKFPDARIIVCADDDYRTPGNPGRTKASEAASAVGGLLAIPDFGDDRPEGATDFNDSYRHCGAEAVGRAVANARVPEAIEGRQATQNAVAVDLASVELRCANSIAPEAVSWLWPDWIAAGKLHILAGPPGTGKTTVAIGVAATLTSGGRWPDGSRCHDKKDVIVWTGEDGLGDTLVPRLIANGADMSRVHFVGAVTVGGERREFDPATDVPLLAVHAARLPDVGLMIVDPIVSAVSGDAHKSNDVRRGLQPLAHLASQTGAAIVGISHFSKGTSNRDPVERVTGSIAFGAAARIVLGAAKRRDDQGGGRILVRAKSNLGPDTGGFVYDLQQVPVPGHADILASRLMWGETLEGTARALLADVETDTGDDERNALADAKAFLQGLLADGPVPSKAAWADAEQAGHARATVRRAMTALGVEARKTGLQGGWVWELPPKVLMTPEDAHPRKVSTFGDDEQVPEDAHSKSMSTFGPDEHLRPTVEDF
ncbi:MAG: AAA family ATPase [Rudaea sp.]